MTHGHSYDAKQLLTATTLAAIMVLSVLAIGFAGTAAAFEPTYTVDSATAAANPALEDPSATPNIDHVYTIELDPSQADSRTEFQNGDSINITSRNGNGDTIDYSGLATGSPTSAVEFLQADGTVEAEAEFGDSATVSLGANDKAFQIDNGGGALSTTNFDQVKYIRVILADSSDNLQYDGTNPNPNIDATVSITQSGNTVEKSATNVGFNLGNEAPIEVDGTTIDGVSPVNFTSFEQAVGAAEATSDIKITGDVNEFRAQPGAIANGPTNNIQTASLSNSDVHILGGKGGQQNTVEFVETTTGTDADTALALGGNANTTVDDVKFAIHSASPKDLDTAIEIGGIQDNGNITNNVFDDFDAADTTAVVQSSSAVEDIEIGGAGSGNTFNGQGDAYEGISVPDVSAASTGEITIEDNTLNDVGNADFGIQVNDAQGSTRLNINGSDINGLDTGIGIDVDPSAGTATPFLEGNAIELQGTSEGIDVSLADSNDAVIINNTDVTTTSDDDIDGIRFSGTTTDGNSINIDVLGDGSGLTDVRKAIAFDVTGASGGSSSTSMDLNVTDVSATLQGSGHGINTRDIIFGTGAGNTLDLEVNNFDVTGDNSGSQDGIVADSEGASTTLQTLNFQLDKYQSSSDSSSFTDIGGTGVQISGINNLQQDTLNHTSFTNVNNGYDISASLGSTTRLNISQVDLTMASGGGTGIAFAPSSGTNLDLNRIDTSAASDVSEGSRASIGVEVDGNVDLNSKSITSGSHTIGGVDRGLLLTNINKHDTTTMQNLDFENIGDGAGSDDAALDIQNIQQSGSNPNTELTIDDIEVTGNSDTATGINFADTSSIDSFTDLNVTDPELGTSTGTGVATGIDVVSSANVNLTIHDSGTTGTAPTIKLADGGGAGIDYSASSSETLDISPDSTIEGVDSANPAADAILVDTGATLDFGGSDLSGYTFGAVNDGIDISNGDISQDRLDNLQIDNLGSGSGLNLRSTYSGDLKLVDLNVQSNGTNDGTGVTFAGSTGSNQLNVTDSTLGTSTPLNDGIDATTIQDLIVDDVTIDLASDGGYGVNVDDTTNGEDVTITDTVTVDGPSSSTLSSGQHATAGIRVNVQTGGSETLTLNDPSTLDISGVNYGLRVQQVDLLADSTDADTPTIKSASFSDIGDQAAISIEDNGLTTGGTNLIRFDSVTIDFTEDSSGDASGTGIDLQGDDTAELINLDITGDANSDDDTGVTVNTGAAVTFDGSAASSASTISQLEEGIEIQSASNLNPTAAPSVGATQGQNITDTDFSDIDGAAAIAVNDSLSDDAVEFDKIDVDSSPSATAIYFSSSNTDLTVKESKLGTSDRGDTVDLGVDVAGVDALTLTDDLNEIGLADSATGGVQVDDSGSGAVTIEDITIAGASSENNRATFGIRTVDTSGTVSIDNPDSADSDISGVVSGIDAQGSTSDLANIEGTVFSDIGDGTDGNGKVIEVGDFDISDPGLTIDNIDVDSSPTATAVHITQASGDNFNVTNSKLGDQQSNDEVYNGVELDTGNSDTALGVSDTDIQLADSDGTGIATKSSAEDLTLNNVLVTSTGTASKGIDVNGDSSGDVSGLNSTLTVENVDTGIDIQTASNVTGDSISGVSLQNIGSGDALSIDQDNLADDTTFTISGLDISLNDADNTGINIDTGGDTHYDLSNNVVSGSGSDSGTGVDIGASSGQMISFDEGVSDGSASTISNVNTGVTFSDGELNGTSTGALINFTEFDNIGGKAIDVADPAGVDDGLTVADVVVTNNQGTDTSAVVEFDNSTTAQPLAVQNLTTEDSVTSGVVVEAASQLNVTDSSLILSDDAAAAGIHVNDGDTSVGIERNSITSAVASDDATDGSGTAIQLDAFSGSGASLIYLNDLEGFTANSEGYALGGNSVNSIGTEQAVANYYGNSSGPTSANGSNVAIDTSDSANVRIYDPFLTADTAAVENSIDDSTADSLDEVSLSNIRLFAHDVVLEPGDQLAFPADSERSLSDTIEVRGATKDIGGQIYAYQPQFNNWTSVDSAAANDRPEGFDGFAFAASSSDVSATAAIEYRNSESGGTSQIEQYNPGYNVVSAQKAVDLDNSSLAINDDNYVESAQTFSIANKSAPGGLNLNQNVSVATTSTPARTPYAQNTRSMQDADVYGAGTGYNPKVSPFGQTIVFISQDEEDFDDQNHFSITTPQTMDQVLNKAGDNNVYTFNDET